MGLVSSSLRPRRFPDTNNVVERGFDYNTHHSQLLHHSVDAMA